MLFGRLGHNIRQQNWFAVCVELLVLIVGLALAFQVDRWWEQRAERAHERNYIERLIADVETDIPAIEGAIALTTLRLEFADLLMDVAADPDAALVEPMVFLVAVDQAAFTYSPTLTPHTFQDLRSTGNMDVLQDAGIRNLLYDYHGYDATQWQYRSLELDVEMHHFTLAAGVLDDLQSRYVQDKYPLADPDNIQAIRGEQPEMERVRAAVARFRANQPLLDWLHQVRNLQMDQIWTHEKRLERAREFLTALQDYRAQLGP
jgi:hypothetical protein